MILETWYTILILIPHCHVVFILFCHMTPPKFPSYLYNRKYAKTLILLAGAWALPVCQTLFKTHPQNNLFGPPNLVRKRADSYV